MNKTILLIALVGLFFLSTILFAGPGYVDVPYGNDGFRRCYSPSKLDSMKIDGDWIHMLVVEEIYKHGVIVSRVVGPID